MATEAVTPSSSNSFVRLLQLILLRPRQGFATIADRSGRAWIVMVLLGLVLVTLPAIVSGPIQADRIREAFENEEFGGAFPPGAQPPEDFDPAAAAASPIITTVFPAVAAALGFLAGRVVWSGALHLISSLAGGRNSFMQVLRTVVWAWIPYGFRSLLQTIYIGVTGIVIENPGLSGFVESGAPAEAPFAAMPPSTGVLALRAILQQIDLYLFWYLALLVIGIGVVARLPRRKALGIVLGVWVLFLLLRVIFATAAGGLAGAFGP